MALALKQDWGQSVEASHILGQDLCGPSAVRGQPMKDPCAFSRVDPVRMQMARESLTLRAT